MEELSVSIIRKSLVRKVVMGNMPAYWLWANIITFIAIGFFSIFNLHFMLHFITIPVSVFFMCYFF